MTIPEQALWLCVSIGGELGRHGPPGLMSVMPLTAARKLTLQKVGVMPRPAINDSASLPPENRYSRFAATRRYRCQSDLRSAVRPEHSPTSHHRGCGGGSQQAARITSRSKSTGASFMVGTEWRNGMPLIQILLRVAIADPTAKARCYKTSIWTVFLAESAALTL
jgi:hypothetical protein